MMIFSSRKTPEREEWYAICDRTGQVFGPFDPGIVWFETPSAVTGSDRLRLQRVTDLILNEAHAGWEPLQKALAFMQPNGAAVYRRFMESGVPPLQTPALGLAGGLDVPGYLGDGAATGTAGLHVDDSNNDTTFDGHQQLSGAGPGPGGGRAGRPGSGNSGQSKYGGSGGGGGSHGGLGVAGTDKGDRVGGAPGSVNFPNIWEAMRLNTWDLETLNFGGAGGGGGKRSDGVGGVGGASGSAYIEVSSTVINQPTRNLQGVAGVNGTGGGGGGGSGGLWVGIASRFVTGSDVIAVDGGAGGSASSANGEVGGAGGDGRVIQVYFDSTATLTVSGAVEDQFRILRSVPLGQVVIL